MAIRIGNNDIRLGGTNVGFTIPFGRTANQARVGDSGSTPDNDIDRIKAAAVNSGLFSRPSLYRIRMTPPDTMLGEGWNSSILRDICFNCDSISIPGQNISTKANKTYGLKKEYAYDKTFAEINATFYCSEDLTENHFFQAWIDRMYDIDGHLGWYNEYKGTIEIDQLANKKGGNLTSNTDSGDLYVIATAKLYDAYPKTLSPLRVQYSATNQVQKIDVAFTYREAVMEYFETLNDSIPRLNPKRQRRSIFDNLRINVNTGGFGRIGISNSGIRGFF